MDSSYAYVYFVKGISETDETKDGKLVQLNYPFYSGETRLVGASTYRRLKEDFPDRLKGGIVQQENLLYVVNEVYHRLKKEIVTLPELDRYTTSRFENVRQFVVGGLLKPDHETESSVNDLTSKVFILQEQVRRLERAL